MMQQRQGNAMVQGSSADNLMVKDVIGLIQRGELQQSIPFMSYNRSTRRAAEKQAKKLMKNLKK